MLIAVAPPATKTTMIKTANESSRPPKNQMRFGRNRTPSNSRTRLFLSAVIALENMRWCLRSIANELRPCRRWSKICFSPSDVESVGAPVFSRIYPFLFSQSLLCRQRQKCNGKALFVVSHSRNEPTGRWAQVIWWLVEGNDNARCRISPNDQPGR